MKTNRTLVQGRPEIFFLIASVLFFFISVMIGLGLGIALEEPVFDHQKMQELKYRQAYGIAVMFVIAIIFDLLGLFFLVGIQLGS